MLPGLEQPRRSWFRMRYRGTAVGGAVSLPHPRFSSRRRENANGPGGNPRPASFTPEGQAARRVGTASVAAVGRFRFPSRKSGAST